MRSLADDRSIVIKKADKGSSVVVWDRNDYVMEAEKQLSDANIYKDVSFNEKMLQDLVGTSNKLFQNLKSKGKISDKQLKYFTYEYKKATNLGKLYLLRFPIQGSRVQNRWVAPRSTQPFILPRSIE